MSSYLCGYGGSWYYIDGMIMNGGGGILVIRSACFDAITMFVCCDMVIQLTFISCLFMRYCMIQWRIGKEVRV